jgi:hypothetical protein
MLGECRQHLIGGNAERVRELLDMLVADHRLKLLFADRKLSAALGPRGDKFAQAACLKLSTTPATPPSGELSRAPASAS